MKTKLPTLHDAPAFRQADEKLQQLRLRRDEQKAHLHEMRRRSSVSQNREAEIDAVLSGGSVATATISRDDIAQADHEFRVLEGAIEKQKRVVEQARHKASAEIREQARPEYQRIVRKMHGILVALREVAVEEREFRRALIDGGVSLTNEMILPFKNYGEPGSDGVRYDHIAAWERDAKAAGMI